MIRALIPLVAVAIAAAPLSAAAETIVVTSSDGSPVRDQLPSIAKALEAEPDELEPLAIEPGTGWYALGVTLSICEGEPGPDLASTVASARMKLEALQSGDAITALQAAIEPLPCASFAVDRGLLAESLDLLGQAAQDETREDEARAAYRQLLALDPSWRLRSPPGTGYEVLWEEVRLEVLAAGASTVSVQHGLEGAWIDGVAVEPGWSGTLNLVPGRHLLQWTTDGATTGAWFELAQGTPSAALVDAIVGYAALLARGPVDAGRKLALELWLSALAEAGDKGGVVVVQGMDPTGGYAVRGGRAEAWVAMDTVELPTLVRADRLRVALGGGWMLAGGASFGDLALAADVRLIGPLHLHLDGDLGFSQPIDLTGSTIDGAFTVLPGVGLGVALRPGHGVAQPFVALSLGVWIVPDTFTDEAVAQIEQHGDVFSRAVAESRGPVTFRGFLDGGVDLAPGDGPLIVRLTGGVGYGFGFQARAGAQVGVRLGRMGGTP